MTVEIDVHLAHSATHDETYRTTSAADALAFIRRSDPPAAEVDVRVIVRGEHARELLQHLWMTSVHT